MNIYQSLNAVMNEIGAIGKDSKNTTQGFMFRGIDAVMNALKPALTHNKVFVTPEVLDQTREERVNSKGTTLIYSIIKVRYTFYAEDGSNVSATVIGEGMDTGDKATNKALSIAFKYACFQVFCIPTEEMIDPDAECHEVQSKGSAPKFKKVEPVKEAEEIKPEPKKLTKSEPALPPRTKLMEVTLAHFPQGSKALENLLRGNDLDSIDKATDAQLYSIYAKFGGK